MKKRLKYITLPVTYDEFGDLYIYFSSKVPDEREFAFNSRLDIARVGGIIGMDFGKNGEVLGVEILDARSFVDRQLLEQISDE